MKLRVLAVLVAGTAGFWSCQSGQAVSEHSAPAAPPPPAAPIRSGAAPVATPSGDVEFHAVLDLAQTPRPNEPELRGGREAASAEWPASLYATFAARGGTAACTAALIGPAVLLTAAHCVPAVGTITFRYNGHPAPYMAACTRHPDFGSETDRSADFALCTVTPAFDAPAGFLYETVSTSDMTALVNSVVVLTGFGCVSSVATGAPFDGKYRIGFATIDETSGSPARTRGDEFYSPRERNNVFTASDPAKINLCPGDSGGPAFARTGEGAGHSSRTIVGVASRVFSDGAGTGFGSSVISATGGPGFRGWAERWLQSSGAAACGLAGRLPTCRN